MGGDLVRLLGAESLLKDQQDPVNALAAFRDIDGPKDNQSFAVRRGVLESDVFVALNEPDSARAILTDLQARYPEARAVKAALEKLR